MDPRYYGLVEMGFIAVIVFGIGFWQLRSLRCAGESDDEALSRSDRR